MYDNEYRKHKTNKYELNNLCKIKEECSFEGIKPAVVEKPYPEIKIMKKNKCYADILSEDFAGRVSELSAITQYINHEIRMSQVFCKAARTLLSIALAEMQHLQRIGEIIMLLDGESCGTLKFDSCCNKHNISWSTNYIDYQQGLRDMILADIKGENEAIVQYSKHVEEIDDPCIKENLERIIEDERYHIKLLEKLLFELDCENDKNQSNYLNYCPYCHNHYKYEDDCKKNNYGYDYKKYNEQSY